MCKFFFNDLLLCLHCHTHIHTGTIHTHTCLHMFVIFFPSAPATLYTVAIPFGYSCSRPSQRARYMNVNPLSLSLSLILLLVLFYFLFLLCVCVCVFCFSLLVAWLYQISLYPFISVAQYLYPAVYPSLCVCVCRVTCRQRM